MRKRCSIQQGEKMITVDQSKVLTNRLFRIFWPPGIHVTRKCFACNNMWFKTLLFMYMWYYWFVQQLVPCNLH